MCTMHSGYAGWCIDSLVGAQNLLSDELSIFNARSDKVDHASYFNALQGLL